MMARDRPRAQWTDETVASRDNGRACDALVEVLMRRTLKWVGMAVLAAGSATIAADGPYGRPVTGRSQVATRLGIVAASQPLAAAAGVAVLERGGNAVDAAIAANAAIGLMEPTSNGIGGDLFALVYDAKSGTLHGLNASGWSPRGLTREFLAERGFAELPQRGAFTVTVPGAVAGWHALREKFGRLPLADSLAPAIHYATEGFPVSEVTAGHWAASVGLLSAEPNSAATFLIDGRAPRPAEVFRNPDLARTLARVAERGRDGFYRGPTANAIVAILKERGSPITEDDLAAFEAEWVQPISTTYRGWTVSEIPPNGQGIAALMMLNLMETFPITEYGFHSPRALHAMIEAKKLAYADLLRYVGDPRVAAVPVEAMLDKSHAVSRARSIEPDTAQCYVQPSKLERVTDMQGHDTIYLSVVDRDGNMVSLIQSNYNGFGSGLVPAGMGFMLHNRGALFSLREGQPNSLAGRKRPLHTIIPGFMEKDGTRISFGIMGGWNQAQAHAQFVSGVADFGFTVQEALEAGRFTKATFSGCDVQIEPLVPEASRDALAGMGHRVYLVPPRSYEFGYGQATVSRPDGVHLGASDPRHDGAAVPESPAVFKERQAR
jgi:gamma-glutamyltranspeptidase/glutathione hydrolase